MIGGGWQKSIDKIVLFLTCSILQGQAGITRVHCIKTQFVCQMLIFLFIVQSGMNLCESTCLRRRMFLETSLSLSAWMRKANYLILASINFSAFSLKVSKRKVNKNKENTILWSILTFCCQVYKKLNARIFSLSAVLFFYSREVSDIAKC